MSQPTDTSQLAHQLLSAANKRKRRMLIEANPDAVGPELARQLKDICVENWAAAPTVTRKASRVLDEIAAAGPALRVMAAFSDWAGGIAEMTHGRLDAAAERLNKASKMFAAEGMEYESAQPQIAALVALAMLGHHERLNAAGKRALKILEKHGDDLSAGKVEINLSNVASRLGRHREAEKFGLSAYARFKKLRARSWQAMAENGLAITYTELNDFRSAEKFFRAALRSARATGAGVTEAEVEASIGNLELFRGRYAEALRSLENSRQKFEQLGMPHKTTVAALEMAEAYAELNLTHEAAELFASALSKLSKLKMPTEEARARVGLGRLAVQRGDKRSAEKQFAHAIKIYASERNTAGRATVLLNQALLEHSLERWKEAAKLAAEAWKMFASMDSERQRLIAEWVLADARSRSGGRDTAELESVLAEARSMGQAPIALLSLNSVGNAHTRNGNARSAREFYRRAVRLIEQSRAPLSGEEFRIAFLAARMGPFEGLAELAISEGNWGEALGWMEAARARSLLESSHSPRSAEGSPEYRAAREQLNWVYHRLNDASGEDARKLQIDAKQLEKKISELLRRDAINKQSAGTNRSAAGGNFDLLGLQKDLGGRVLVEYVSSRGRLSAFAVTENEISYVPDLCSEDEVAALLEELQFQFGALRYGRTRVSQFIEQMKLRADSTLERIYSLLLKPLEWKIRDQDMVVVPVGAVHYVPFSALRSDERYVVEGRSITIAPSALVWRSLSRRRTKRIERSLLVAFTDEAAPLAEDEVSAISEMFADSVILSGKEATVEGFETHAAGKDLVHFACHGQFRADNPLYSNLRLADGNISVRDIAAHRLRDAHVALSACETGLNQVLPGEEIIGLARGFISAGVRSLLLTLWTVNDEAAKRMMVEFYSNLQRGNSFPASLRLAQLKFIEDGEHPYYWAPFFSIG